MNRQITLFPGDTAYKTADGRNFDQDALTRIRALQSALARLERAIIEAQEDGPLGHTPAPTFRDLDEELCLEAWAGKEGVSAAVAARTFQHLKAIV